jgi:ABC-type phosphate/phosphonate transport system substrate-binding protein
MHEVFSMKNVFSRRFSQLLAGLCLLSGGVACAQAPVTVGVVLDMANRGDREPLRAYLSQSLGWPVKIAVPDNYRQMVEHL